MSQIVAAVVSPEYRRQSVRQAVDAAMKMVCPSIGQLIKPGDRVALKLYLNALALRTSDGTDRRVSHPMVVTALIEVLKDCGALVTIGDEGSRRFRDNRIPEGRAWLYAMEKRYGVKLVSFAKAGARHVQSHVPYPRSYLIANALLDVDRVVSCVNCRPHPRLLLMGAVRNMFNAIVGQCQSRLYRILKTDSDLARVMADVCGIVRPTFSLLDMTTVMDTEANATRSVGLMLASTDPAAVDTVAAQALGLGGHTIWTTVHAEGQGLGCAAPGGIQVIGDAADCISKTRVSSTATGDTKPNENVIRVLARAAQLGILEPRPVIRQADCSRCGDCEAICPVGAVTTDSNMSRSIGATVA